MDRDGTGVAREVMGDVAVFSREVLKKPLYGYQLEPVRAILESVWESRGEEFLLIMARQSGKNELVAQLLVYLLNALKRKKSHIVYAAIGDNVGRGIRRLEEHLDNKWNRGQWRREGRPTRRGLGEAAVVFMSSHPQAHARGETAHHLLVVDELQDQDAAHVQAVFQPMRAAGNATAVYLGTVRTTYDPLWLKKEELERLQTKDGRQRVFMVGPEAVCAENGHYERFLAGQIAKHGRKHPLIKSEYFLEPLDCESGLFPRRRVELMRGGHERGIENWELGIGNGKRATALRQAQGTDLRQTQGAGEVYIATLDVAGIDEGTTDPTVALDNPARDYTTCTVFRVVMEGGFLIGNGELGIVNGPAPLRQAPLRQAQGPGLRQAPLRQAPLRQAQGPNHRQAQGTGLGRAQGPVYEAVDVFVDQGSQHFRESASTGSPSTSSGTGSSTSSGTGSSAGSAQVASTSSAQGGRPSLARQLLAFLEHWQVSHLVGDATGVGEGLLNWLAAAMGESMVTAFKFTRRSKAQLGVDFVALVETNRFKYFREEVEFDDAWWFFEQAKRCVYELEAGRPMETHMRWFVPGTTRVSAPTGMQALHDDRLVSAALVAEVDKLIREGKINTGRAESIVTGAYDPLEDLPGF